MNKLFKILAFYILVAFYSINCDIEIKSDHFRLNNLGKKVFYLFDSGKLSFDEIKVNTKFVSGEKDILSFGFINKVVWVKIPVENKTDKDLKVLLEYGYPMIDYLELYYPTYENGEVVYNRKEAGMIQGFKKREVKHRYIYFDFLIEKHSKINLYLKIDTTSSVNIILNMFDYNSFIEKDNVENLFLGIFYGIMIVLFLNNLFLLLTTKEISYLFYLFWIVCATMVQLTLNGFTFQFILKDYNYFSKNILPFFMTLGGFWGITFAQTFLSTKDYAGKINKVLDVFKLIVLLGAILSLYPKYSLPIKYATVVWIFIPILMFIISFSFVLKGYKPARFFLLSWTMGLVGMWMFAAKSLNLLPNNFITMWGMQIGVGLEGILLSIALGDKINEIKKEQLKSKELLIRTKSDMLESFSRFVPKEFLTYLNKQSIEDIDLGDATTMKMTVLFSDMRNFTKISESMTASENFKFINNYLKRMEPIIKSNSGFVDKYIGDSIMALFPNEAQKSLIASISIVEELKSYNSERALHGFHLINIGIGLNTGELMLGTVGSERRLDTTVIGDAVNIASRIEGLTKIYRNNIIITEETYNELTDKSVLNIREIDIVRVVGKTKNIKIYEVFNCDNHILKEGKIKNQNDFTEAINYYREGKFSEALKLFKKCRVLALEDYVLTLYIDRCNYLMEYKPENWDGVSEIFVK